MRSPPIRSEFRSVQLVFYQLIWQGFISSLMNQFAFTHHVFTFHVLRVLYFLLICASTFTYRLGTGLAPPPRSVLAGYFCRILFECRDPSLSAIPRNQFPNPETNGYGHQSWAKRHARWAFRFSGSGYPCSNGWHLCDWDLTNGGLVCE